MSEPHTYPPHADPCREFSSYTSPRLRTDRMLQAVRSMIILHVMVQYGAKIASMRQSMFPEEFDPVKDSIKSFIVDKPRHTWQSASSQREETMRRFEELTYKLGLKHLFGLPLVALSNGQIRRARIVKALLA
ncbi:hypothetical protein BC826DRAFT_659091 [Russula brevipes]|nr:hypothetical protein BC826DRAFT_659091 [Russula brevipes]